MNVAVNGTVAYSRRMPAQIPRRDAIKQLTLAGAGLAFSGGIIRGQGKPIVINGKPVEIVVAAVSPTTVRITLLPLEGAQLPDHNALVPSATGKAVGRRREAFQPVRAGDLTVRFTEDPPTLQVEDKAGPVQRLVFDAAASTVSFLLPKGPLLGFGEGGPQFDKKGTTDRMRNGQGGYQLRTHGGRVPDPVADRHGRLGHVYPSAGRRTYRCRVRRTVARFRAPRRRRTLSISPAPWAR